MVLGAKNEVFLMLYEAFKGIHRCPGTCLVLREILWHMENHRYYHITKRKAEKFS